MTTMIQPLQAHELRDIVHGLRLKHKALASDLHMSIWTLRDYLYGRTPMDFEIQKTILGYINQRCIDIEQHCAEANLLRERVNHLR